MDAGAPQVLAFRLARQHLARPAEDPAEVLRGWAVQDSPPGAAAAAVAARVPAAAPGTVDRALEGREAVALYNARTATAVVPAADAAAYGTAQLPRDDAGLRAILLHAVPGRQEDLAAPVALAVDAIADVLDGRELSRDELHAELRLRLPAELLPWCEGCRSHHARRGLLVMASLRGRLCLAGRAGRQPRFARTDQRTGWDPPPRSAAGAQLVRGYLSAYGPSTPAQLAAWAGLGREHARELWDLVAGELEPVTIDGAGRAWILARDLPALREPPPATGVRLLGPGDPLLLGRDRDRLVADPAVRTKLWRPTGAPGLVLAGGRPAALWRARKQGRRLAVTVEPFDGPLPRDEVEAEASRLAPHRECTSAAVAWAA
jgi:hypothetical protein